MIDGFSYLAVEFGLTKERREEVVVNIIVSGILGQLFVQLLALGLLLKNEREGD